MSNNFKLCPTHFSKGDEKFSRRASPRPSGYGPDWYRMRGTSQQSLQPACDRFSAAYDEAVTKISSKKIEVLCLSRRPRLCILQVSGNTLQQGKTFKYLEVVFTSDGSRNKGITARTGEANAVLRELCRSVVTKRELSKTTKLSVFKSVFVPILTCGRES